VKPARISIQNEPDGESGMISAILLAAGESRRMGTPKALLTIHGTSFIRHLIDVLRASKISSIVVVLGAHADEIQREIAREDVKFVINTRYHSGQLSSIRAGIEAVRGSSPDAVLLQPIDHPLISPALINGLIDRFTETQAPVVVPVKGGKRGHPVIFSKAVFDELARAPEHVGARAVVWEHERAVVELITDDERIFSNIDTREDYERLQRNL
jgi:molybdenum cofactor cytidylyltransferase